MLGTARPQEARRKAIFFEKFHGNPQFFINFRKFAKIRKSAQKRLEFFCVVGPAKNPKM
jgi:hypothetical protein